MIYDYIIIGGGISGLYSAHILQSKYNVLLLEQNDYLGGRIKQEMFHQTKISMGAGIIHKSDKHIFNLIKKFKIKHHIIRSSRTLIKPYNSSYDHSNGIELVRKKYLELKSKLNSDLISLSFTDFLDKYFGKIFRKNYIDHSGYTDYVDGDINYHIKYYTLKADSFSSSLKIFFDWDTLIMNIKNGINYKLNTLVTNITINQNTQNIEISTSKKLYVSRRIIFALPIKPLITLTRNLPLNISYDDYIQNANLLRIYTFHKDGHKFEGENIGGFNIIPGKNLLRKIIVINDKILMSSYCDMSYALYFKKYLDNKKKLKELIFEELQKIIPTTTKIDDIVYHYWDTGVHCFKPLHTFKIYSLIKSLQNPIRNVFVVGELCSFQQGWTNGAVDSVEKIRTKLLTL